jgi:DNA-binding NtrC family response regulator
MPAHRILVVDDEQAQRSTLAGFLAKRGFEAAEAASGESALEMINSRDYDLVLTDQKMTGISGVELLEKIKQINPEIEVILITAFGDVRSAVRATKAGAFDYITKPVDLEELEISIGRALERRQLVEENRLLRHNLEEKHSFSNIVSASGAMEDVLNMAARVARVNSPVLITGESGTGKEMVARAIHQASGRADRPFVAVNCAALNRNLIESELFGHEKGAFTGAVRARSGKIESAATGTLFLDELGEISPEIQVKLLRFLQEGTFEHVGSDCQLSADVRLLAATNRDLEQALAEGKFREDFYYRINVVNIHIPPLRSRREDIRCLAEHFVGINATSLGDKKISREALDALLRYDFPGNIRELQNMVERAMVMARGDIISTIDLPPSLVARLPATKNSSAVEGSLTDAVQELEKRMITEALASNDGVQVRAAAQLGITERNLRYKIKKLGL